MSTRFLRAALTLAVLSAPAAACSSDLGAKSTPEPASTQVAVREAASADEPCGTAEHPCLLPEIRVNGAARN